MANQVEWVKSAVLSAPGTGDIVFGSPFSGYIGFDYDLRGVPEAVVRYIVTDGANRERGIGVIKVTPSPDFFPALKRLIVEAKIDGGSYEEYPATPLNLSISTIVSCEAVALDYQENIINNPLRTWVPVGNGSTSVDTLGLNPVISGTLTARAYASTTAGERCRRVGIDSAASSGASVHWYENANMRCGNGTSSLGGFRVDFYFRKEDLGSGGNHRQFVGIRQVGGAPSIVDPATLTNVIGFGIGDSAGSNELRMYYGGSSAQTPIVIGSPYNDNNDLYHLTIQSYKFSSESYEVILRNKELGYQFRYFLTPTSSGIQTPSPSIDLGLVAYRGNGGSSSLAVKLDVGYAAIQQY